MDGSKILDKNDIDIVVYDEDMNKFVAVFIVWHYYETNFGRERANKIHFITNDNVIAEIHKLSSKNVILLGDVDCISKINDVTNGFMQIKNIVQTWNYFFPEINMPHLLNYIYDNEFMAVFSDKMYDFEEWIAYMDDKVIDDCIVHGKTTLANKSTIINSAMNNVTHIIQDIDGVYMYMVYVEVEFFKQEACAKLHAKYPICDMYVAYFYDKIKNMTTYCVKSVDNTKIVKNHVGMSYGGAYWLKINNTGLLPYRTINDYGLLKNMRNKINGIVAIKEQKYNYVLMDVAEIREEWIENDFSTFLKRKNIEASLIVFEKPSDEIEYDREHHTMIALKDYVIIHNGLTVTDGLKNLQFNLCNNEYLLCITTEKEFGEIF